jgi:hypothetical protein
MSYIFIFTLINLAVIITGPSQDGIERRLATSHARYFLLTNLRIPKVLAAGEGIYIAQVANMGYQLAEVDFSDSNFQVKT